MVELLVVGIVVLALLSGMALVLAESGKLVWVRADGQITTITDAQRALDRVSEDLRRGKQANLTCVNNQLAFDLADGSGRVTYARTQAGTLTRAVGVATASAVAGGLVNFSVPSCAGGLVKLEVTAQMNLPGGGTSAQTLASQVWVQSP
jgi:hypothetical protein